MQNFKQHHRKLKCKKADEIPKRKINTKWHFHLTTNNTTRRKLNQQTHHSILHRLQKKPSMTSTKNFCGILWKKDTPNTSSMQLKVYIQTPKYNSILMEH